MKGFSLIELLVAVAIVGIAAAIAAPSYSSYLTKTRRGDATIALTEVAGEQTRFFTESNRYAATMGELGYGASDADNAWVTPEGHYSVTVSGTSARGFVLTAAPVAGGAQADDAECGSFTLSSTGAKNTSTGKGELCW